MQILSRYKILLAVPLFIMVVALVLSIAGFGMNMGIDFTGGTLITYDMGGSFQTADIESALGELGVTQMQVGQAGEGEIKDVATLRIKRMDDPQAETQLRSKLEEALKVKYPAITFISTDYVSAVAGDSLFRNALSALAIAIVLMLCYIVFRFDLFSGLAAIFGLLHDVLLMCAFMVLLRNFVQINSSFVAAILTIVGYSINNTIVIFDRVRENRMKGSKKGLEHLDIVKTSVSSTLMRSVNTTLTTLITITVLYILGVDSIREFALPLIIGLIGGAYSSVFLVGPVWALMMDWNQRRKKSVKAGKAARVR